MATAKGGNGDQGKDGGERAKGRGRRVRERRQAAGPWEQAERRSGDRRSVTDRRTSGGRREVSRKLRRPGPVLQPLRDPRGRPAPVRPDPERRWLTAPEATYAYGLNSVKTLYSAADRGAIRSKPFGARGRRYLNPAFEQ